MKQLNRVIEGLTLVLIGCMLLANSAGVLSWRVWLTLLSLWPLLLISIGVEIIGKGAKQPWLRVASSLIVISGLLYVALLSPTARFGWSFGSVDRFSFEGPSGRGVEQATLSVSLPVNSLAIASGDDLVAVAGRATFEPEFESVLAGRGVDVRLHSDAAGPLFFTTESWAEIELAEERRGAPVWDIELDSGATDTRIDVRDIAVHSVDIDAGVALVDLTLGDPDGLGEVSVNVSTGISSVTVRVPEDAHVLVSPHIGIGDTKVELGEYSAGEWETDGFEVAEDRYVIVVEGAIGRLSVLTY